MSRDDDKPDNFGHQDNTAADQESETHGSQDREPRGRQPDEGYEVGYKKPPRHTQFKPGESGRSRERKRKRPPWKVDRATAAELMIVPRTFTEAVQKAAAKAYKVREGGKVREVLAPDLLVQRILHNAITSNSPREQRLALDMLKEAKAFGARLPTTREMAASLTSDEHRMIQQLLKEYYETFDD